MSKLPFGSEVSPFGKAIDSEIFHLEREALLVYDFGSILLALLMYPKSGRKSSAKKNRRNSLGSSLENIDEEGYRETKMSPLIEYTTKMPLRRHTCRQKKERFTVSLEANAIGLCKSRRS